MTRHDHFVLLVQAEIMDRTLRFLTGHEGGQWARLSALNEGGTTSTVELARSLLPTNLLPGDRLRFDVTVERPAAAEAAQTTDDVRLPCFLVVYTFRDLRARAVPAAWGFGNRPVVRPSGRGLDTFADVREVEASIAGEIGDGAQVVLCDWRRLADVTGTEALLHRFQQFAREQGAGQADAAADGGQG